MQIEKRELKSKGLLFLVVLACGCSGQGELDGKNHSNNKKQLEVSYAQSAHAISFEIEGGPWLDQPDILEPIAPEVPVIAQEAFFDEAYDLDPLGPMGEPLPLPNDAPWMRNDPRYFSMSIFDPNLDIDPWLANYVGSYGVLPTRFQDKGPFLYSFDISPDADIFNDDDLDPWHHLHDDDDRNDDS